MQAKYSFKRKSYKLDVKRPWRNSKQNKIKIMFYDNNDKKKMDILYYTLIGIGMKGIVLEKHKDQIR